MAHSKHEALKYYYTQTGEPPAKEYINPKTCTNDTMWYGFDYDSYEFKDLLENSKKEFIIKKGRRDFDMEVKLSFSEVIKIDKITKPCIIASTEI